MPTVVDVKRDAEVGVGVPKLHEPRVHAHLDAQLLGELPPQRPLVVFPVLDASSGKLPETAKHVVGTPLGDQEPPPLGERLAVPHHAGDHVDVGHRAPRSPPRVERLLPVTVGVAVVPVMMPPP